MEYVAVDLETRGLIEKGVVPDIICYSWATLDQSGVSTDLSEFWDIVGDKKVVFHNASFDNAVLAGHGILLDDYEDTMILSYCLNPSESHALARWGEVLNFKKMEKPWEGNYPEEYTPELNEYCKRDAELTIKLFHYLLENSSEAVQALYTQVELPYSFIIQEMERTGMYFDKTAVLQFHEEVQSQLSDMEAELTGIIGLVPTRKLKVYKTEHKELELVKQDESGYHYRLYESFNLNSRYHKAYALKKMHPEWIPEKVSKDGVPTMDSSVLEDLNYPLAEKFREIAKLSKINSSFLTPVLKYQDENGFVHGNFNQTVTITGRLSSSNPNLQNLPSRGEMGTKMRSLVTTPSSDIKIVGGDLSNIEARVLAYYLDKTFGERSLAEAFINDLDAHQQNADNWGLSRDMAKKVLYLTLYGGGANKLSISAGVPLSEAEAIINQVNSKMPAIEMLKKSVYSACRKRGFIRTLGGRILAYPNINSTNQKERGRAERQAFNALLQGSAADILKMLSILSFPIVKLYGARYVASIHDELLFYVDDDKAVEFASDLSDLWSNSGMLDNIPTKAEFKVGESWSQIH